MLKWHFLEFDSSSLKHADLQMFQVPKDKQKRGECRENIESRSTLAELSIQTLSVTISESAFLSNPGKNISVWWWVYEQKTLVLE